MGNIIGLDLGSYAIKLVEMKRGFKGESSVEKLVSFYNPTGQYLPTDEADLQKLAVALKQSFSENKFKGKEVNAALPEGMAYTSIISMPNLSEAELASSIHWEAEQHIPVPLSEVNLEYEVLYRPKKGDIGEKMKVLLVAARTEVIDRYVYLMELAGIEVSSMETVLLGVYRSLNANFLDEGAVMIVHMGALTTDLLVVHKSDIVLSYSIQTGGLALTRAVEKQLELPPNQAEEYKRAYGLDPAQLEGRVRQSLSGVMNIIISEMRKAMQYYQTSHTLSPIRTMWLSGGAAYLPGLPAYLAEAFSYEVELVNPLSKLQITKGIAIPKDLASYTPAVGMALKEG
jgi:type IV pilus assembly protein PilM